MGSEDGRTGGGNEHPKGGCRQREIAWVRTLPACETWQGSPGIDCPSTNRSSLPGATGAWTFRLRQVRNIDQHKELTRLGRRIYPRLHLKGSKTSGDNPPSQP